MTMAEVLESIRGLGERFDRHAKRLQALERETGDGARPRRRRLRRSEES